METRASNVQPRAALRTAWNAQRRACVLALAVSAGMTLVRLAAGVAPEWTERLYSRGLYPWIQRTLGALSGLSPWSLGELGLLALAVLVVLRVGSIARARVHRTGRAWELACTEFLRLLALAGWLWALYMLAWGLNHARLPYAHGTGLDVRAADAQELEDATRAWLRRALELRVRLPEAPGGTVAIEGDFARLASKVAQTWERAGLDDPRLAGAEPVLRDCSLSLAMKLGGISGIYWPFTAEPHVNTLPPVPQRVFSALHEVAHQRGFAREDEANYLAVLVGSSSADPALAYPVALTAFRELRRALSLAAPERAQAIARDTPPPVRRDLESIATFWAPRSATQQALRSFSTQINDTYLKSQGQRLGVASYGRMVDLLLAERRPRTKLESELR